MGQAPGDREGQRGAERDKGEMLLKSLGFLGFLGQLHDFDHSPLGFFGFFWDSSAKTTNYV